MMIYKKAQKIENRVLTTSRREVAVKVTASRLKVKQWPPQKKGADKCENMTERGLFKM